MLLSHYKNRKQRGFSLLEISVVLVIIAAILGSGLTVFNASLAQRQVDETNAKLAAIQKALYHYRLAYNRLPCPADGTLALTNVNFGVEAANSGSCTGGTPAANFSHTLLTNVTIGGTPSASSQIVSNGPEYAFDSTSATKWVSNTATGWLQYKLASAKSATQYVLISGADNSIWPNRAPNTWQLQGSNDGSSWTGIDSQTGQSDALNSDAKTYTISSPGSYSYYRLNISANNGDANTQLSELQLLASISGAAIGGMIPIKTLRLPDDYAIDGWGRRINYSVIADSTRTNGLSIVPLGDTSPRLIIKDASGNTRTNKALYIVMSSGPNGHGAWPRSGGSTRFTSGSTNTDELNNCDCDNTGTATTFDGIFVQKPPTKNASNLLDSFDDILVYATRSDLRSPTE